MIRATAVLCCLILLLPIARAADGLVSVRSPHSVKTTVEKLTGALEKKGMRIFDRIDHSAGARTVGKTLRPTELLIFGNPKVGTPLMQCSQTVAIDLPQKALVWEDEKGQVWLSYNDPAYLSGRHDISGCDAVLKKVSNALAGFARAATAP